MPVNLINKKLQAITEHMLLQKYGEAAQYFRIGESRLRQIVAEQPDADFVLRLGNRILIKRKLFEDYLTYATEI